MSTVEMCKECRYTAWPVAVANWQKTHEGAPDGDEAYREVLTETYRLITEENVTCEEHGDPK
jgi:hypothetical protein